MRRAGRVALSFALGGALAFAVEAAAGGRAAHAQSCIQSRPTDPGGFGGYVYAPAAAASYGTTRVLVWYATSGEHAPSLASTRADGVPDDVVHAAEVTDDALVKYAQMGYRAPVSDGTYPACSSNGGDGRLDVYLVNFTAADGQTVAESCTAAGNASLCASFILAEAKSRSYSNWDEAARTILPHEAFHAVQNAYDANIDRFWAEGTAQWAAKTLDPALRDLERNLPAFFSATSRPLDQPAGTATAAYLYGAAIWPVFLAAHHSNDLVREILEQEGASGGAALAATDAALKKHDASLATDFPLFAAWNASTGDRAGTGGYADGASYPQVKVATLAAGGSAQGITSGLASFAYRLHTDGAQRVSIETDAARNAALVVPLEGGKARLDQVAPAPATVQGDALIVVAGVTTKKSDAPYTLHADAVPDDAGDAGAEASDAGAGADGASSGGSSGCAAVGAQRAAGSRATERAGGGLVLLVAGALVRRRRS